MRTSALTASLMIVLIAPTSTAQDSSSAVRSGAKILELATNASNASVYAGDVLLGRASQRFFTLPDAPVSLKLVLSGRDSWSIPPIEELLPVSTADTVRVRLDFPYYYRVESTPYGASVYTVDTDTLLGTTPLEITVRAPLVSSLILRLPDYWPEELDPGSEIWNVHAVRMRPVNPLAETSQRIAYSKPGSRKKWIDYAALGTAAVAGVVAVHYKFKADRRYDTYRESGDPALRPAIKRYDVYSGVALGVMQAGLGLFAIRLVLR